MSEAIQLAGQFFSAASSGDMDTLRSICSKDLVALQNGAPPMPLESLIQFTGAVLHAVKDFRYENAICSATETGFVEEHDVVGTLPDGSTFKLQACVVAEVKDGKITLMREYFDSRSANGLIKALAG